MDLEHEVAKYLEYCTYQKKLDEKTVKAYRIDLGQLVLYLYKTGLSIDRSGLTGYISELHKQYKPKSVKRKIASAKAFAGYLEYEEVIDTNPFAKLRVHFKEPVILPRTIPFNIIKEILTLAHNRLNTPDLSVSQRRTAARDVAVLELLFATGTRVSELCSLKKECINLVEGAVLIYGKGAKERLVEIEHKEVLAALSAYHSIFAQEIEAAGFFFINRLGRRLSEQSVRFMVQRYADDVNSGLHITPHMFRHSFATLLMEADVDTRYIQALLGHSSIVTTQIYTHVASKKQRDILAVKHPRNKMSL